MNALKPTSDVVSSNRWSGYIIRVQGLNGIAGIVATVWVQGFKAKYGDCSYGTNELITNIACITYRGKACQYEYRGNITIARITELRPACSNIACSFFLQFLACSFMLSVRGFLSFLYPFSNNKVSFLSTIKKIFFIPWTMNLLA